MNFLQHIYRSLKANGRGRAAVILTDSVLSRDSDGRQIRNDLMDKCNLHTVLRLPTGIFNSKEVKTNVLFFTRGENNKENTREEIKANNDSLDLGIENKCYEEMVILRSKLN